MASIFTKIINRELEAHIVAEEAACIAFLDIHPIALGHTLVVPKKEVDYVFELDNLTLSKLMLFAKRVAIGIQKAVPCLRVGMAVIGLEVPHAHVHLLPLNNVNDLDFKRPKLQLSRKEYIKMAAQIRAAIPD